jgi:NADH:ubiquinone oxidoreductase subunit D
MHSGILRTSGMINSLPLYLISELCLLINDLPVKLQEIHNVISRNRIWLTRLASVGIVSKKICELYALGGVLIRAADFKKDLRLTGYETYSKIDFNVVNGSKGDSMDR